MRRFIEASLVLTLSIVITVVIIAVAFPRHVLGGGPPAIENPNIWPAVFVYGVHERPGTDPKAPFERFADRVESGRCPYLAALTAASRCPAAPERATDFSCPYLEQLHRQLIQAERTQEAPRGQNT